ncbi:MAG: hypothetical protein MSIBF_03185 [Candidatus Altiarchaeales archaeon IMC4]|nr:MAG: hypothetical protein MSIBF_03185 [Candidatus Altiarchaeales archaeon IMC4]
MKLCSLFSGGKDSVFSLYIGLKQHEVAALLSMVSERDDSYMYHTPNIKLTKYSSEAIGIPLVSKPTKGAPPAENEDLFEALSGIKDEFGIEGICVGAVHSNYQYKIVSDICRKLSLEVFAPIWQRNHADVMRDFVGAGFEALIVNVAADGLDESWLGRKIDTETIAQLEKMEKKFGLDAGGEGGCYETLVIDGPIFKKRLEIIKSRKIWDGVRGQMIVEGARLLTK